MGDYVYKVTGKIVTDNKGRKANVLKFAYKPWNEGGWFDLGAGQRNNELRKETGCYNADRYVRTGKTFTGRLIFEGGQESIRWPSIQGTISDAQFDHLLDKQEGEDD